MLLLSVCIVYSIIFYMVIKKLHKKSGGMTLVETLVAIAIMSLLMLTVASLLASTSKSEKRNRVITEVEYQASALIYEIAQSARNASSIVSPLVAATSTTLNLVLSSVPAESPTIFSLTDQALYVSRGGAAAEPISSDTILVTGLTFENISALNTHGAIRVTLNVQGANPNNKPELVYATSRTTTITLR
jgi:prepilin-type N-terminal cleavage/methylation domain-containing protein